MCYASKGLFLLFLVSAFVFAENIYLPNYKSLYVLDGDSANIKMRLKGIDTPEIGQKCQIKKSQISDCGYLAKHHLQKLLKTTEGNIKVEFFGFDDYQRALIKIYKGNTNINQQMVLDGYAFSYHDYCDQQQSAEQQKLGFWSFHKPPRKPRLWRRQNKNN